jgi:hypothetical protein
MLPLLGFPGTAQHVAARTAFEVAEITETIIPADRLHGGIPRFICGFPYAIVLMSEQLIKIAAVYVGI